MAREFNLRRYQGPGKFEGGLVIDEVAYVVSLEGFCDEEESFEDGGGWYGLIRGSIAPSDEDKASLGLTADEVDYLAQVAGCIISEGSQGFVSVDWFDESEALDAAWSEVSAMFDEDEDEDSEDSGDA